MGNLQEGQFAKLETQRTRGARSARAERVQNRRPSDRFKFRGRVYGARAVQRGAGRDLRARSRVLRRGGGDGERVEFCRRRSGDVRSAVRRVCGRD